MNTRQRYNLAYQIARLDEQGRVDEEVWDFMLTHCGYAMFILARWSLYAKLDKVD